MCSYFGTDPGDLTADEMYGREPVPAPRPSETPLPCPFCGKKPGVRHYERDAKIRAGISCDDSDCGAWTGIVADSHEEAVAKWNRRSPSVPTAAQEQRDAGVAEATYWRDKAKHMAALMAMAGATLCEPVSTANIRDAKKSCDLGVHVMREIIDDEKRVSSSEEAANSDTRDAKVKVQRDALNELLNTACRYIAEDGKTETANHLHQEQSAILWEPS